MTPAEPMPLLSIEEYLAAETDGEVRHEYLGGYLYAMAGARTVHNRVAANFLGILHHQLRGQTCEPFNSDMKVRVQLANHTRFYYPDGMVVCSPNGPDDPFQDQPVVIAEVISESTRRTDEGEKREAYLTIPSLQVYLLIETGQPRIVAHRPRLGSAGQCRRISLGGLLGPRRSRAAERGLCRVGTERLVRTGEIPRPWLSELGRFLRLLPQLKVEPLSSANSNH